MPRFNSAIDVARADILADRIRETAGHNRSPEIDAINRGVGLPLGSPYCAAGVSHCFRAFALDRPDATGRAFPYSGGSQAILAAFRRVNGAFTDPQHLMLCTGALFGWTNSDGEHGHIGFVERRLTDGAGRVVAIGTLEYNTSPQTKDRDGEGGYRLVRPLDELLEKHSRLWFLDTSLHRGGRWWPK